MFYHSRNECCLLMQYVVNGFLSLSFFLQKPSVSSSKEVSRVEFVTAAPEQPSPISALDTSFYQDDWPRSPSKKNLNSPKGMCL